MWYPDEWTDLKAIQEENYVLTGDQLVVVRDILNILFVVFVLNKNDRAREKINNTRKTS